MFERKLTHLLRYFEILKSSCTVVHSGFRISCALHIGNFSSKHGVFLQALIKEMKENKIAIIKNGVVENVIVASVEFGNSLPDLTIDVTDLEVGIGWVHNADNSFSHSDVLLSPEELLIKKTICFFQIIPIFER